MRRRVSNPWLLPALWRGFVSLWMAVGIAVLALAAIELVPDIHLGWKKVLRLVDPEGGKPDRKALADAYGDADWTKAYWREYARTSMDYAPWVLWRSHPLAGHFVTVDAAHHRKTLNPELADGAMPIRVWMFGGSTLFGMGARDEHTVPSELARLLAPLGPVEVTNFGQPGWVSGQEAAEFAEQLRSGDAPDIAVFYDGVNDVFSMVSQRAAGLPQNLDNRIREFNLTNPERHGELYRAAVLSLLERTNKILMKLGAAPRLHPPAHGEEVPGLAQATARDMAANADQSRALAKAHGVDVLFALQPVLFTKKTKTAYEQQEAIDFSFAEEGFQTAVPAILAHPSFKGQPDFRDLTTLFDDRSEPYFVDFIHLGETGNAVVAEALAQAVAPLVKARLQSREAATAPAEPAP